MQDTSVMRRLGTLFERDDVALMLSLMVQIPIAFFLGHYYDMRISMGTGYLVGEGLNPYEEHALEGVFQHEMFSGMTPGTGYPPPWSLLIGFIYLLFYRTTADLFIYNFAIKLPILAGNIFLAYAVRHILHDMEVDRKAARRAWLSILYNPFIILTTSAWGQIDGIVASLVISSLHYLHLKMTGRSAILLGLAVSLKPVALPLLPLPIIYTARESIGSCVKYIMLSWASIIIFSILPFFLFGWDTGQVLENWDAHHTVAGGLSIFGFVEAVQGTNSIPDSMYLLGFIWIPAVAAGYILLYPRSNSPQESIRCACSIILVFLLTRAWVSEPNLNLLIPFLVMLVTLKSISRQVYTLSWVIPIAFAFFNTSIAQLFALTYPQVIDDLSWIDKQIRGIRLMAGYLTSIVWQVTGWNILIRLNRDRDKN